MPPLKPIKTCRDALMLALEMETHLRSVYMSLANVPTHCEAKKTFRLLSEESNREICLIVNELNFCDMPVTALGKHESELKAIAPPDITSLANMSSEEIIDVAIQIEKDVAGLYEECFSPIAINSGSILANLVRIKSERIKALNVYREIAAISKQCSLESKSPLSWDRSRPTIR